MDLTGKTILILGGSGLVGRAVARKLFPKRPAKIVLVALYEEEVRAAAESLATFRGETELEWSYGNVFQPAEVSRRPVAEILSDASMRSRVLGDVLDPLNPDILQRSLLYQLFDRYRPDAVVDCINTATAFAYQNVFRSATDLLRAAREGALSLEQVERHLLTLTMPQLIRHVQIMLEATTQVGTQAYIKIGTSGTGGMGLNIPYTHSEERPSRTLLTKSAVAGAHSLLLFLMDRTPGGATAIEVKPTAAIAWREIAYGPIRRGGRVIPGFDCAEPLALNIAFDDDATGWTDLGNPLESVYIDVGENGVFARDEFETVTSLGQMEFITPEEVATYVVMELEGKSSGRNVVAALDAATAGPTYQAGVLRAAALERLEGLEDEHEVRSVGFEMLGPPRLTKMLYESYILSRLRPTVQALADSDPHALSDEAVGQVTEDARLRSTIVSVGLPILVPDGKVYRAETVMVRPNGDDVDVDAARGWVDLRPAQCRRWIERAGRMVEQATERGACEPGTGSDVDWSAIQPADPIVPARFVKWVFRFEDDGERIKR